MLSSFVLGVFNWDIQADSSVLCDNISKNSYEAQREASYVLIESRQYRRTAIMFLYKP